MARHFVQSSPTNTDNTPLSIFDSMALPNSFHQFARLPTEIQLIIWQFAFRVGPLTSHTPLLVTTLSSLSKALALKHNYIRKLVSDQICESSTWPRLAPMPRNWLIHDKNIYSSHGDGEWKIFLRSNSCVEGECWSVKHVRMEAGESVCLGGASECEEEAEGEGYRIVLSKKEGLTGLLQACTLSRVVVLEEWRRLLEKSGKNEVEGEHYDDAISCAPHREGWEEQCDGKIVDNMKVDSKKRMIVGIVGKMLDELKHGAGVRMM